MSNRPVDKRHSGATESKRFETTNERGNFDGRALDLELHVYSWSPGMAEEKLPCTQVHIVLTIGDVPGVRFVQRFKSREALSEFIDVLIEHKDGVWPPPQ
jgi:hypothetical protein